MRCQSRILKDYKIAKADCMWPESIYGPTDVGTLPVCNGEVTIKIKSYSEPSCCGRGDGIELEATCSRCKHPWFPKRFELEQRITNHDGFDITEYLM